MATWSLRASSRRDQRSPLGPVEVLIDNPHGTWGSRALAEWHLLHLVALSVTPSPLNFSLPEEQLPAMVAGKLCQLRFQGEHFASG